MDHLRSRSGEAGAAFARLVDVMDRLRSPGGCPWDAQQTHASLARYVIEEAFELADAAEHGDRVHLREEIGDVLLQVVFHARVAQEDPEAPFDVVDVIDGLIAKLVRRHPHVFADVEVADAAEVTANWERIKQDERAAGTGSARVPLALPALVRAQKVARGRMGAGPGVPVTAGGSLGERLLAIVLEATSAGLDAEGELRRATAEWERGTGVAEARG